jgi:hypothetical protein
MKYQISIEPLLYINLKPKIILSPFKIINMLVQMKNNLLAIYDINLFGVLMKNQSVKLFYVSSQYVTNQMNPYRVPIEVVSEDFSK